MSDISIEVKEAIRLLTAGKYCRDNIVITPVGGASFATILVRFSADYTVSCTNGEDVLPFISVNEFGMFNVPYDDEWVVTATPDNPIYPTMSDNISISQEGQVELADVRNAIVLISPKNGVMPGVSVSGRDILPAVDITDYKTLVTTVQLTRQSSTSYYGSLFPYNGETVSEIIELRNTTKTTYTLDVTNLTGSYNVRIGASSSLSVALTQYANNITFTGSSSNSAKLIGVITDLRFLSYSLVG